MNMKTKNAASQVSSIKSEHVLVDYAMVKTDNLCNSYHAYCKSELKILKNGIVPEPLFTTWVTTNSTHRMRRWLIRLVVGEIIFAPGLGRVLVGVSGCVGVRVVSIKGA